jgi:aspartyl-tRNA(Asn)/glutamyl-tRNA(Gln) amidotransferase subunit A
VRGYFSEQSEPETRRHTETLAERLGRAGATVEEAEMPPSFGLARAAQRVVHQVETATFHEQAFRHDPGVYAPQLRATVEVGLTIPASAYLQAQRIRRRFRAELGDLLSRYDALMMPATPAPAPRGLASTGSAQFLAIWTFAGVPAVSVPTGLTGSGLPLGTQLVAGMFRERHLLAVARWCERTLNLHMYPTLAFA